MLVTLRAGNTVDGPYRADNNLVRVAAQRGYIVVTPMGYRGLSQPYYGSSYQIARPNAAAPAAGWTAQENERAEQDVDDPLAGLDIAGRRRRGERRMHDGAFRGMHVQRPVAAGVGGRIRVGQHPEHEHR